MAKKSVTHFKAVVEAAQRGEKIWVGVDVHTKKYAVAILSESGVRHSFVTNSDNQALVKQFTDRGLSPEVIVYEAGLTGFGLYRACQAAGQGHGGVSQQNTQAGLPGSQDRPY